MKILIISGFLGAGKTTFIKELVKQTQRDFAILENEFGTIGIDGKILGQDLEAQQVNIWELTEGCICCSVNADFTTSVLTIANAVDPEFLIIEPSGVGMLSNILRSVQRIEYEKISILAPITILDIHSFERYRREYGDIYGDQVEAAHRVLLSKSESSDPEEIERVCTHLLEMNPDGVIEREHYSKKDKEWWDALLEIQLDGTRTPDKKAAEMSLETLSLKKAGTSTKNHFVLFLEDLVRGAFGDVIRAKGCVQAGDEMLRFDVVDHQYIVSGVEGQEENEAVFIGNELDKNRLRKALLSTYRPARASSMRAVKSANTSGI